jgi:hypothetical protein
MMNRMRDGVDELAAKTGSAAGRSGSCVTHRANNLHRQFERERRDLLAARSEPGSCLKRKLPVVLDSRIASSSIVIHFPVLDAIEQALEMIEAMPVMASDRGVENLRDFAVVPFVIQRLQQSLALAQDFDSGSDLR